MFVASMLTTHYILNNVHLIGLIIIGRRLMVAVGEINKYTQKWNDLVY